MSDTVRSTAPTSRTVTRTVEGKGQLLVSALGVALTLLALWWGAWVEAGALYVATMGMVGIMFQRAVTLYHAAPRPQPWRIGRAAPQPAGAGN